jgi:glycosyltransferase involved in cell wall biosynthesis
VSPVTEGLTAVVPCFNEEENVESAYDEIVTELGRYDLELLFVDDGSSDGTLEIVRRLAAGDPRVRFLSFSRNFGLEAAFSAGYRYASRPWIVHIDADVQFPVAETHKLVPLAEAGMDAVFGIRGTRHDPLVRRAGARAYHFVAGRLLGIEIPPGATTFRLVRTSVAVRVVDLRLGTPYFLATIPRLTNRYTCVEVEHRARRRGTSKLRFRWLVGHALSLFVGFSNRMATAAALTGVLLAGIAVLLGIGTATGLVGAVAALTVVLVLLGGLAVIMAVLLRFLVAVRAGQARPRMFYIREANVSVDPADRLIPTGEPVHEH